MNVFKHQGLSVLHRTVQDKQLNKCNLKNMSVLLEEHRWTSEKKSAALFHDRSASIQSPDCRSVKCISILSELRVSSAVIPVEEKVVSQKSPIHIIYMHDHVYSSRYGLTVHLS